MNQKLMLTLAVLAGFVGGVLSQYISPALVHAQAQSPKEIRAQSFVLVNENDRVFGLIGLDPQGQPIIKLKDQRGRIVWSSAPGYGPLFPPTTARR